MTARCFVEGLREVCFDNMFNPYSDRCAVWDLKDAAERRSGMLSAILEAASTQEVDVLWVGRDLGYRGGRRTGLAFTDDVHLETHAARWGVGVERATRGSLVRERTAGAVWRSLGAVRESVFLWNVFPFHPHERGSPFSNRRHTRVEGRAGEGYLAELMALVRPGRVVAVGADAERAARRVAGGREVNGVRHPSYGGQALFERQVRELHYTGGGRRAAVRKM